MVPRLKYKYFCSEFIQKFPDYLLNLVSTSLSSRMGGWMPGLFCLEEMVPWLISKVCHGKGGTVLSTASALLSCPGSICDWKKIAHFHIFFRTTLWGEIKSPWPVLVYIIFSTFVSLGETLFCINHARLVSKTKPNKATERIYSLVVF